MGHFVSFLVWQDMYTTFIYCNKYNFYNPVKIGYGRTNRKLMIISSKQNFVNWIMIDSGYVLWPVQHQERLPDPVMNFCTPIIKTSSVRNTCLNKLSFMARIGKYISLLVILTNNLGRLIRRLWINIDTDLNTVMFGFLNFSNSRCFSCLTTL